MILLTKDLQLYDDFTYGVETWGSHSQDAIEFKRKHWYITHWTAGSDKFPEDFPEVRYDMKLDVIKEFKTYAEAKEFVNNLLSTLNKMHEENISLNKLFGGKCDE